MFKLMVLCALFAAAAAKPDISILGPITHYSYLEPASTTITKQDSSVIHPTPLYGYSHFIKKRSPQLPVTYVSTPAYYPNLVNYDPTYQTPLIYSSSIQSAPIATVQPAVHLIKKRSAPLIPTTYYAPNVYTATYSPTAPIYKTYTPLISPPIPFAHFIKKRSAPLLTTYVAPTSYSHQSRFDLQSTHYPYSAITYPILSTPLAYSHL